MTKKANFRVILSSLNPKFKAEKDTLTRLLSMILETPEQETRQLFDKLPVILYNNIGADELKYIKDRLIFLSKMGLEFNITWKEFPELHHTGWHIQKPTSVAFCPSCGEEFVLIRAQDFYRNFVGKKPAGKLSARDLSKRMPNDLLRKMSKPIERAEKAVVKAGYKKPEEADIGGISAELEEVEVLSEELKAIVASEEDLEDVEYIDEVGSISEEMREMNNMGTDLESIGGISAEFEEIDVASAEFRNIYIDGMENDIGSLSAELEEIEGISAELAALESEERLERAESRVTAKSTDHSHIKSSNNEIEELEEISAELEQIAEPLLDDPVEERSANQPLVDKQSSTNKNVQFPPGNYDVMINSSGKGNIETGIRLMAKLRGENYQKMAKIVAEKTAIVVAKNVSQDSAQMILEQFQRLNMQGKVIASRKRPNF